MGSEDKSHQRRDSTVTQTVQLVGAVTAIVTALVTVVVWLQHKSQDPFLAYYLASAAIGTGCFWAVLRTSTEHKQRHGVYLLFGAIAAISTLAVVWRYITLQTFLDGGDKIPFGFDHGCDFLPYFLLLGACTLACVSLTLHHTSRRPNKSNRTVILGCFVGLILYSVVCRLAWHVIEQPVVLKIEEMKAEQTE